MNCNTYINTNSQNFSKDFSFNLTLNKLKKRLDKCLSENIYYYVLSTLRFDNNKIIQTGTGPNLEGGLITLCTCKHNMRTYPNIKENTWIAGFTSINDIDKLKNYLFYLFRIKKTFDNQFEYYTFLKDNFPKACNIKNSKTNEFGDLFFPKRGFKFKNKIDYNNPQIYLTPHPKHGHINTWNKDIERVKVKHWGIESFKNHKLLIGDIENSFVWNLPMIYFNNKLTRGQKKATLKDFIKELKST